MSSFSPSFACPHCSYQSCTAHGLKVHIGRIHKTVPKTRLIAAPAPAAGNSPQQTPVPTSSIETLESLGTLRQTVRVLRHIPKGARNLAAGKLCALIDRCIEGNGTDEWSALLTFAYTALRVPEVSGPGNITTKVKQNIEADWMGDSTESRSSLPLFCSLLPGLKELNKLTFNLLGSPIFPEAIPDAFRARERLLVVAQERLRSLSAHVAMTLLRSCFAVPKINYFLRTVPTWLCPVEVQGFDGALKDAVEQILNVSLSVTQWEQAALPIRHGGLGIRRAVDVGLPAFIASAHGVVNLVTNILPLNGDRANIPFAAGAMEAWTAIHTTAVVPDAPEAQRSWDQIGAKRILDQLIEGAVGSDLARLRAVSQPESGAWLHALPSPHIGTLLDGDSLRVAVALRLGCDVCEKHLCICGSMVEANGHHALSCCRCSGRFPRHHALNDILRRALISANIPNVLEPPGLSRMDGKRPDGLTMVPWKKGKCLLWDATCVSTFAASHLGRTTRAAGAAAELAAVRKREKYSALEQRYLFVPFAVETTGCWGSEAKAFVKDIGCRLRERGCDPRSGSFLVQRLSIAIQRGNAASVMGTFAPGMSRGGIFD
ncbi:hypothetical protein NE865_07271 [Phthorimaea operculella]|nr:hypothetical protein NE865_07271 [Phthorimaea operculella]